MIHSVDFYKGVEGKPKAAFVILYALDGKPWEKYIPVKANRVDLTIPSCLMINRADAAIGFVGGKVDNDETLEQAAIREVQEEIGHALSLQLEPIVAHDIGSVTTHVFAAEVSYSQLRTIQKDAVDADHFGAEVTGVFLPHLFDYNKHLGRGGGIVWLLQSKMMPSVREEMTHFLLKKSIFTQSELETICSEAGYTLEELLT